MRVHRLTWRHSSPLGTRSGPCSYLVNGASLWGFCHAMPSDLQDCKNGTYKAAVRMDKTGLASIHAQINGQPLGLPATLHVLPAELHSLLLVTPPAIETTAGGHLNLESSSLQTGTVWQAYMRLWFGRALKAALHILSAACGAAQPAIVTPLVIDPTEGRCHYVHLAQTIQLLKFS